MLPPFGTMNNFILFWVLSSLLCSTRLHDFPFLYIILLISDQGILKNIIIPANNGWRLNTQRHDVFEEKADML